MVFRVNIDKWLRGDEMTSVLLNNKGQMCCLGFVERQCGASPASILNLYRPEDVDADDQPRAALGVLVKSEDGPATDFTNGAIAINDDANITDTERMKRLRALAKKHGHRFVFVRGK